MVCGGGVVEDFWVIGEENVVVDTVMKNRPPSSSLFNETQAWERERSGSIDCENCIDSAHEKMEDGETFYFKVFLVVCSRSE